MRQVFGFKYGVVGELDYIDDRDFVAFPLFRRNGIVSYYFESRKTLKLEMVNRVILRPRLNKGRIRDIKINFFIPTSDAHQKILNITKSHDALNIIRDDNNNSIGEFKLNVLPAKRTEIIAVKQVLELSQFKLNDYGVIKLVTRESTESKYKLKREIIEIAEKLRANNDLMTLINCIRFVKSRVKYVKNYFRLGALFALKQGKGSCSEITDLCASILDALGYYARVVIGYVIDGGFHAWLEVLSRNYGWIPIDPTLGLIGGIGLRWIRIYSEIKQNQRVINYNSRPRRLSVSLEYYLEGEKLV